MFMGLDVGDVRIGVAFTDALLVAAHPTCTVQRKDDLKAADEIVRLCRERGAKRIVIGIPYTEPGEVGHQGEKIRAFAAIIAQKTDVPIVEWDETMTSADADLVLNKLEVSGKRRREIRDRLAAAIMLESYLEHLKSRGELDVGIA